MSAVTLEKVLADVRQLSAEDAEKLRRLLNGAPATADALFVRAQVSTELSALPCEPRIVAVNVPMKDRSRERAWLEQHRDDYGGEWVALDGERLLAHGKKMKEVTEAIKQSGVTDAFFARVEPRDALPWAGF